ncbi:sulfite oxidase-like oxidoreductase [Caulobacter sp. D4A]|uniref:sulfite oxidase-like oxidoreductase n=1 Tax=unclassified Caulobacter TaxID=2648921 RepID=UPI000D726D10|nr:MULTISPECIES: sulfite oxidase-like oxidoreductase [unclassified Caulobacter]PXA82711.1 sulfite oxidase-like oxidoreductase [Caulobacter sp. D4A]PXA94500.1 sulfite oxidase-like oxidoreductase [Caulobacter sp. D5]
MDDNQPPEDSKLTRSKEAWARAGKFLTGHTARPEAERLPPGQHLTRDWPVLDLGLKPDLPTADWRLRIDGLVARPATWDFQALLAQPQSAPVSDIHCVTTWSRYDNHWQGVLTRDLAEAIAPRDEARFVVLHSYDGYTTNLTLEDFLHEGVLLAHGWEGAPITAEHGGPVRLVAPHLYFWKSAKWLKRIEFVAADKPGFWEERGYHNRGDPWAEERYW